MENANATMNQYPGWAALVAVVSSLAYLQQLPEKQQAEKASELLSGLRDGTIRADFSFDGGTAITLTLADHGLAIETALKKSRSTTAELTLRKADGEPLCNADIDTAFLTQLAAIAKDSPALQTAVNNHQLAHICGTTPQEIEHKVNVVLPFDAYAYAAASVAAAQSEVTLSANSNLPQMASGI